jgi:soluble lytic murein transglycosylase
MKLWILFLSTLLSAQITLDELSLRPPSHAKNFLIWQFLQQDITPTEADTAFDQIENVNTKLFFLYAKKTDRPEIAYIAKCMNLPANELLKTDDNNCLQIAITPWGAALYTNPQIKELESRVFVPKTKRYLDIMSSDMNESTLLKYAPSDILTVINGAGKKYREDHFNHKYSLEFIEHISKSPKISQLVEATINDNNMDQFAPLLLNINPQVLDDSSSFTMAIHYLLHDQKDLALKYLTVSNKKAFSQKDKDKTIFWKYLITNDIAYLKQIALSMDINVYTLYAKEVLNIEVTNYFTEARETLSQMDASENIKDPFAWMEIKKEIKHSSKDQLFLLSNSYGEKNNLPLKALTLEKAYAYKMHSFIMPYEEYTASLSNDEKALFYALMRQESQFIPSAISSSYALGLMQLMPFLVDALNKQMPNKTTSYSDMFNPQMNISYAIKHISWLNSQLNNPLFKAYAYNGGLGFTRKYIKSGKFTSNEYEPFLSMDTMSNVESREYGKKVLANYAIYKKILNEDFSIVHFFDKLKGENQISHLAE